jgi:hypothetical protein
MAAAEEVTPAPGGSRLVSVLFCGAVVGAQLLWLGALAYLAARLL